MERFAKETFKHTVDCTSLDDEPTITYSFSFRPTSYMESRFLRAVDRDNAGTWTRMDRAGDDDQVFNHSIIVFDDGVDDGDTQFTTFESDDEMQAFFAKVKSATSEEEVEAAMEFHGFRDVEDVASF
ncbi:hypothetical protein [Burkholderia vietnamiensis]|uniref:hypothetical protein n=1 Tax=Burkholderia vietnamiensis TaxID=60552 RepID=UPI001CF3537F|nr:hypothetical protein [Burkholderia vietnamiensis]MCA8448972.1 hypothetical protein [Burkholderia vietnamiensis]